MAYNFGLPSVILLSSTFLLILKKAIENIKVSNKSSFNYHFKKPWLISVLVILIAHLSDITYYDGKISLILATILAGLKNISLENESNSNKTQLSKEIL